MYEFLNIRQIDENILLWVQEHLRNVFLTKFFTFYTHLGDHGEIWIFLIILFLLLATYRKTAVTALCSLVVVFLLVEFKLKIWVERVRPYLVVEGLQRLVEAEASFSFPSGHASSSFAVAYVFLRELPLKYGIPIIILAILMAYSRIYVGVHYPTDILVGALVGIGIGEAAVQVKRKITNK